MGNVDRRSKQGDTTMTVEEYLANGGTITRCPTVYLERVTGAAPIRSGISDRILNEDLPLRDRKRISHDVRKLKEKAKDRSASLRNLEQYRLEQKSSMNARNERLMRLYLNGESISVLSKMEKITEKTLKKKIRRAGFTGDFPRSPYSPRPPISKKIPAPSAEMVRLHNEGLTVSQIYEKIGKTVGMRTIRNVFENAGIKPNSVRVGGSIRHNRISDDIRACVVRDFNSGMTNSQVAAKHGISKTSVIAIRKEAREHG